MNTQTIDQTKQFLNIAYVLWETVEIEYTEDYAAMVEGLMLRRDIRWADGYKATWRR